MCLKSTENNTLFFWAKYIRFKIRIFRPTYHKPNMGFDTDIENITKGDVYLTSIELNTQQMES